MKITDYPKTSELSDADSLVVETVDGTKRTDVSDVVNKTLEEANIIDSGDIVLKHRTYRGKNIGTSFTNAQKEVIQDGTFDDLYVGDYWSINGYTWRIMDINYFINPWITDENVIIAQQKNHVIVMPDESLLTNYAFSQAGDAYVVNEYKGGYRASLMYRVDENDCKPKFESAFGSSNLIPYKNNIPNSINIDDGKVITLNVNNFTCTSPKVSMIFGGSSEPWAISSNIPIFGLNVNPSKQFAIFKEKPEHILLKKQPGLSTNAYFSSSTSSVPKSSLVIGSDYISAVQRGVTIAANFRPFACIG